MSTKLIAYYIEVAFYPDDLEVQVNRAINQGYKPIGGITFYNDFLYQAMILDNEEPKKENSI